MVARTSAIAELTGSVGSGQTSMNRRSSFRDILVGPIVLLGLVENVRPSIEVRITVKFRDVRRDQRERLCRLISELAQAAAVRVVASGLRQRWLREHHRGDLPSFSVSSSPRQSSRPLDELLEAAREEIEPKRIDVFGRSRR